jgi:NADPH:quinone reductase-like Zn-dependent oxidoreductase
MEAQKTYQALVLTGKGGLDRLELRHLPLREPGPGELRVRVRAAGAGSTDVLMRIGNYPYRPPFPFTVGYELVGEVDAVGAGVSGFARGERVCAMTVTGAQAEYVVRSAEEFVKVPQGLDDAEVVALPLNYATAYQLIHRCTELKAGQSVLVTGANGGVGSALLELLRPLGVRVIGAASPKHFGLLRALGAEPIDARGAPLDQQVRALVPRGVDVAFDGLGGKASAACLRATRRGGRVVGYGFMAAMRDGAQSTWLTVLGFLTLFIGTRLRGRSGTFYGITQWYRRDKRPFKEDLQALFGLLGARKIAPRIDARLALLDGVEAQRRLETGGVVGKIVLLEQQQALPTRDQRLGTAPPQV